MWSSRHLVFILIRPICHFNIVLIYDIPLKLIDVIFITIIVIVVFVIIIVVFLVAFLVDFFLFHLCSHHILRMRRFDQENFIDVLQDYATCAPQDFYKEHTKVNIDTEAKLVHKENNDAGNKYILQDDCKVDS
ncbi:hypothetical protein GRF29_96g516189 [Pseudopithomyces chartarum]|uniref:Uncharacterized protein n=1 Tax=Pseudopithomyces chartarum TaxID=1892770 RepID=A0AAN6RGH3_9PLEO|nr:hypothetical protein GRF29_96g516189 [Pseudopithomyces chartarum]